MLSLSRNAGLGGYKKVFDRGIGCPMGHWTDDTLYRDTTAQGWAMLGTHEKSRRAGSALRPICSNLWSLRWVHKRIAIERNFATGVCTMMS